MIDAVSTVVGWLITGAVLGAMLLSICTFTGVGIASSYRVEGAFFVFRARLLDRVTYCRQRVMLEDVEDCRPFDPAMDLFPGGWHWGIVLRPWWTLVLRRGVLGARKVFITPQSEFELEPLLGHLRARQRRP